MNNKLRKQFENIAEIKEMLLNNDELKWCDESKRYINGRVFQDAETGYINGALFGWIQSANREGYKLVPLEPSEKTLNEIKEKHWDMRGFQLCRSDYNDLYKAMIGAIE